MITTHDNWPRPVWKKCTGEAHSNLFIDHCMVCAPYWLDIPTCSFCGGRLKDTTPDGLISVETTRFWCPKCRKHFKGTRPPSDDPNTVKVAVFINRFEGPRPDGRSRFDGYVAGDPLALALEFRCQGEAALICELVFGALNRPEAIGFGTLTTSDILRYHNRWPSLSVGDVVVIGGAAGKAFACQSVGWLEIDMAAMKVVA